MKDLDKEILFLEQCSNLFDDEASYYWQWLVRAYDHCGSFSDEMEKAVENEIINTYQFIKENTEVVTKTIPAHMVEEETYTELVWKY